MIGGISMMQPSYSFMYNRLPLSGAEQAQSARQAGESVRQAGFGRPITAPDRTRPCSRCPRCGR